MFEYYSVDHDTPEPLFSPDLKGAIERRRFAFFFGGIGDGRNLYATLMTLAAFEMQQGETATKNKYHFTINDLQPHALARDLLVLMILEEISQTFPESGFPGSSEELLSTVYYIFIAPCMPAYAYTILQERIEKLLDALQDKTALPTALDVRMVYRDPLVKVLKGWKHHIAAEYTVSYIRDRIRRGRNNERVASLGSVPFQSKAPAYCKKEEHFYMNTALLLPPPKLARVHTKKEYDAYGNYRPNSMTIDEAVLKHVDANWNPNVTMIDLDWERERPGEDLDVNHNPFELAQAAYWTLDEPTGLYDVMRDLFWQSVLGLHVLRGRLTIEAVLGDVTIVLEQIRYGLLGHRAKGDPTVETNAINQDKLDIKERKDYPYIYDCIHLSNIPDYIGGTIPIVLYALPNVYKEPDSLVTFNCLRNTPRFRSHAHYNNEYAALSKPSDLEKTFQARLGKHDFDYLASYTSWYRSGTVNQPLEKLMPQTQLETWLYRFFLKTAIPYPRNPGTMALIYSPLNLTAVFRICELLYDAGYPAHWLNGVLSSIISASINTTARPPRSEPLKIREVNTIMSEKAHSTAQFTAEMSTLAAIWSTFCSFPILSDQVPPVNAIRQYRVRFEYPFPTRITIGPTFVIVFIDMTRIADVRFMHTWLLDDELARRDEWAYRGRTGAMHVLTTWHYDRRHQMARFWLRQDVMETMKKGMWAVQIWRTDTWVQWSDHKVVGESVEDTGRLWTSDE